MSVFPAESFVTAESCTVASTTMLVDAGLTVTDGTGTFVLPGMTASVIAIHQLASVVPFHWP